MYLGLCLNLRRYSWEEGGQIESFKPVREIEGIVMSALGWFSFGWCEKTCKLWEMNDSKDDIIVVTSSITF